MQKRILNATRLYTNGKEPIFDEGDVFKTMIPLIELIDINNPTNEGTNSEVEGVNPEVEGANTEVEGVNAEVGGVIVAAIEEIIVGARQSTKDRIADLVKHIYKSEGKRIPEYASATSIHRKTLEAYMSKLRENGLIEFIGESPKIGGYYITDRLKKLIDKKMRDTARKKY